MNHTVKILSTHKVLYNVRQFNVEKPKGFKFTPGQATDLSIDQPEWKDKKNPFTFTSLEEDPYLQFTIKMYPHHKEGVTRHLDTLQEGDELIIGPLFASSVREVSNVARTAGRPLASGARWDKRLGIRHGGRALQLDETDIPPVPGETNPSGAGTSPGILTPRVRAVGPIAGRSPSRTRRSATARPPWT